MNELKPGQKGYGVQVHEVISNLQSQVKEARGEIESLKKREDFVCTKHDSFACFDCIEDLRKKEQLISDQKRLIEKLVEALERIKSNCHGDAIVYARVALEALSEARKGDGEEGKKYHWPSEEVK